MQVSATSSLAAPQTITPRTSTRDAAAPETTGARPSVPRGLPPLELIPGAGLPRATADFAAELGGRFRSAGIRVPPEPVLTSDYAGKVVVANDHPDKARIEALFESDFELSNRFRKLAAGHHLQRAVENYDDFVAAYDRLQGNPEAQAALVNGRIARNEAQFFMHIGIQGAEPFFGGLGRISA